MRKDTACSRELGHQMRLLREAMGVTAAAHAARIGWGPSKVCRVEAGSYGVTEADVAYYLGSLEAPQARIRELRARSRDVERGYWIGDPHSLRFHAERATSHFSYHVDQVPGPLNIADNTLPDPADYFLHEKTLRIPLVLEQIVKVMLLAEQVAIRIVPAADHFGGSFQLLEFADHAPLVHIDGLFVEQRAHVAPHLARAKRIAAAALDPERTRDLLVRLAGMAGSPPCRATAPLSRPVSSSSTRQAG